MAGVQQLVDVLACSAERARALLAESGGDIETAIALHFANPSGIEAQPQSPR